MEKVTLGEIRSYFQAPIGMITKSDYLDILHRRAVYGYSSKVSEELKKLVDGYLYGEPGDECSSFFRKINKELLEMDK